MRFLVLILNIVLLTACGTSRFSEIKDPTFTTIVEGETLLIGVMDSAGDVVIRAPLTAFGNDTSADNIGEHQLNIFINGSLAFANLEMGTYFVESINEVVFAMDALAKDDVLKFVVLQSGIEELAYEGTVLETEESFAVLTIAE